jgi:hypothetical protein
MKNAHTGESKEIPVGFSWTTLFFGFFPALFRRDWKNFLVLLLLTPITLGVLYIIYCFKYNNIHTKDLVGQGYKVMMTKDEAVFMSAKIGVHLPVYVEIDNPLHIIQTIKEHNLALYVASGLAAVILTGVIARVSKAQKPL